jgi:putative heme utilization carrier protein HutX
MPRGRQRTVLPRGTRRASKARRDSRSGVPPVTVNDLIRFLDGTAIAQLSEETRVSPLKIVENLPSAKLVAPEAFVAVMDDIVNWGVVILALNSPDGAVEFTGPLPRGAIAHGCFYWVGEGSIRGRLRPDRCRAIAFVERSFMGRPSASVLFFNQEGAIMLTIVLPPDGQSGPHQQQLEAFRTLAGRLSGRRSNHSGQPSGDDNE